MTELAHIRLRTLGWFLAFPLAFFGLLPWWLHRHFEGLFLWQGDARQWLGVWLIANGAGLAGWCVNLFNIEGRGTPLPLDPPTRFVASGPYRFVRNPMMLGIWLVLGGEAFLYQSKAVAAYLLVIMALAATFVRFIEEPDLERRFGPPYLAYKRTVPRWVPRLISGAPRREKE